jgi:hypothetical protein
LKITFPRDADLFTLLWKHKILTTRAIWLGVFQNASLKTCYERLLKLRKSNYIRRVSISDNGYAWSLSVNGFNVLKAQLPEFKVPGYGSESPLHDLLVPIAAYSDFWPNSPRDMFFLTEEEIKRLPLEALPQWFPIDLIRRPDGIWNIKSGQERILVALEVETSIKAVLKYETIARQYQDSESISRVIWIVPTLNFAETIFSTFKKRVGFAGFKHEFVFLSDLIIHGWNAKISLGSNKFRSLSDLFNLPVGNESVLGRRLSQLDISLSPHKSRTSPFFRESEIPNLATYIKTTPFHNYIKFV